MRVFPSDPECHKTTHRETGNRPVIPVGNCIVIGIYIFNKFREIYRELAIGLYRTNIVWAQIVFIIRIAVITVRLNYYNLMTGNKIRDIISIIVISFIKSPCPCTPKIPLRPAMEKIYHRISLFRLVKIIRR